MIIKRNFTPASMWPYARFELILGVASSLVAWLLFDRVGFGAVALPAVVATVLGTALSILLAVRANTAYQRWWEASGIWAQIVGLSRNLVRVVVTVTDAKSGVDRAAVVDFQQDVASRQVAYANALRHQLRGTDIGQISRQLSESDRRALEGVDNKASALLSLQSGRIHRAFGAGLLTGLDNFQMEVALAGLSTQQALAERLAMQPVPRTYDVFSRYLVHLYVGVFPFAVIGSIPGHRWIVVIATVLVAFAFRMIERIGSVVEAPFGNTVQDLPLSAIGTLLERDLLELVGTAARPAAPLPTNGYLW